MQQESQSPMSGFQAICKLLGVGRVLIAAHGYVADCWLQYGQGPNWPPLGVKVVAVFLPLIHTVGGVILLSYHPEYGPLDFGPVMLTFYPTMAVMAYRTVRAWFNTTNHSYYSGYPYIAWVFGGDEIAWKAIQSAALGGAAYFAPWGLPFSVYLGCMGVAGVFSINDHFVQMRRRRRAIRDGMIDGQMMMY